MSMLKHFVLFLSFLISFQAFADQLSYSTDKDKWGSVWFEGSNFQLSVSEFCANLIETVVDLDQKLNERRLEAETAKKKFYSQAYWIDVPRKHEDHAIFATLQKLDFQKKYENKDLSRWVKANGVEIPNMSDEMIGASLILARTENQRHQVLLVFPADITKRPSLRIPGGNTDPGETPEMTAVREIKEELGLEVQSVKRIVTEERITGLSFYTDNVKIKTFAHYYSALFVNDQKIQLSNENTLAEWFDLDQILKTGGNLELNGKTYEVSPLTLEVLRWYKISLGQSEVTDKSFVKVSDTRKFY